MLLCSAAVAVGAVLYRFDPALNSFYPRCLFHEWTGLHCPACGSLRALHELTHGHLLAALGCNPLLVAALPFLAYAMVSRFLRDGAPSTRSARWFGRGTSSAEPVLGAPTVKSRSNLAVLFAKAKKPWIVLIVVLVFMLLRNIPIPPFTLLAP